MYEPKPHPSTNSISPFAEVAKEKAILLVSMESERNAMIYTDANSWSGFRLMSIVKLRPELLIGRGRSSHSSAE